MGLLAQHRGLVLSWLDQRPLATDVHRGTVDHVVGRVHALRRLHAPHAETALVIAVHQVGHGGDHEEREEPIALWVRLWPRPLGSIGMRLLRDACRLKTCFERF